MSDEEINPTVQLGREQSTNVMAVYSLAAGIACWVILPILGAFAAIACGHIAKKQILESGGMEKGSGLATAGLILGYLQVILIVIPLCIITIMALLGPGIGSVFSNIMEGI